MDSSLTIYPYGLVKVKGPKFSFVLPSLAKLCQYVIVGSYPKYIQYIYVHICGSKFSCPLMLLINLDSQVCIPDSTGADSWITLCQFRATKYKMIPQEPALTIKKFNQFLGVYNSMRIENLRTNFQMQF